jgi:AcrR family transcriptional regulator
MPFRRKRPKSRETKRRRRRSPEEARALILAAAKRVFAEVGPDAAGLKDVAREAGVSHGLVTHYFGTFGALVEASLEDLAQELVQRVLARLATVDEPDPVQLLDIYFDEVSRPEHGRLLAWMILSRRVAETDFFARRLQGPKRVVDAIEARIRTEHPDAEIRREEIEWMIILVMSVGFGISVGRGVIWEALGREYTEEEQRGFRIWLGRLVRDRLPHVTGQV